MKLFKDLVEEQKKIINAEEKLFKRKNKLAKLLSDYPTNYSELYTTEVWKVQKAGYECKLECVANLNTVKIEDIEENEEYDITFVVK